MHFKCVVSTHIRVCSHADSGSGLWCLTFPLQSSLTSRGQPEGPKGHRGLDLDSSIVLSDLNRSSRPSASALARGDPDSGPTVFHCIKLILLVEFTIFSPENSDFQNTSLQTHFFP